MGGRSDSTKVINMKKMKGEYKYASSSHDNGGNVVYCNCEKTKIVIQTSKQLRI